MNAMQELMRSDLMKRVLEEMDANGACIQNSSMDYAGAPMITVAIGIQEAAPLVKDAVQKIIDGEESAIIKPGQERQITDRRFGH